MREFYSHGFCNITFKNLSFNKSLSMNPLFHQNDCHHIIFRNITFNKSVNMTNMIFYCDHLKNVIFENILFGEEIITKNMICNNMYEMNNLYISFKNITITIGLNINRMFLNEIYYSNNFNMEVMFENINAPELKKIENMCDNHGLKKIYFKNINLSKIESFEELFTNCLYLQYLYFENIYTPKLKILKKVFDLSNKLIYINFTNIDISKVTSMKGLFSNKNIRSIIFKNISSNSLIDISKIFYKGKVYNSLDLSGLDTSNVKNMESKFESYYLNLINITDLDTSSVTNMNKLFLNCDSLYISNFNTWNICLIIAVILNFWICQVLIHLNWC